MVRNVVLVVVVGGCATGTGPGGTNPLEPTEACNAYVDCLTATESPDLELEQAVYGADGSCWLDASDALDCNLECESLIQVEHSQAATVAECWPGRLPVTGFLFNEIGTDWYVDSDSPSRCSKEFTDKYKLQTLSITPQQVAGRWDFTLTGYGAYLDSTCNFEAGTRSFTCGRIRSRDVTGRFNQAYGRMTLELGSCTLTLRAK